MDMTLMRVSHFIRVAFNHQSADSMVPIEPMPLILSKPSSWSIPGKYSLLLVIPLLYTYLRNKSLDKLTLLISKSLHVLTGVRPNTDTLRRLLPLFFPKSSRYQTYQTREQEDDYWENADLGQRELSSSDARYSKCSFDESLDTRERQILYYTPRLLPEYRNKRSVKGNLDDGPTIPAKAFVKWHWLVFPDRQHPSLLQASRIMQHFSPGDLREVYRISKLARCTEISRTGIGNGQCRQHSDPFQISKGRRSRNSTSQGSLHNTYRAQWRAWLQKKEPEVIILFEEN